MEGERTRYLRGGRRTVRRRQITGAQIPVSDSMLTTNVLSTPPSNVESLLCERVDMLVHVGSAIHDRGVAEAR
jgi:hypothetical protein